MLNGQYTWWKVVSSFALALILPVFIVCLFFVLLVLLAWYTYFFVCWVVCLFDFYFNLICLYIIFIRQLLIPSYDCLYTIFVSCLIVDEEYVTSPTHTQSERSCWWEQNYLIHTPLSTSTHTYLSECIMLNSKAYTNCNKISSYRCP